MPIRDADRRLRLLGKIRLGDQQPTQNGKMRPAKLTQPRLTSPTRDYLDAAALVYGGEVTEWEGAPGEGKQWQLYTTVETLDIIIPPIAQAHSDWYEMWSAGGCARRCDGVTETLSGGDCMCPADHKERAELAKTGKACKMTTRLNVLLPQVPDVGVWMLETHGYYAWAELGGVADFLAAKAPLSYVPGRLRLDARTAKRRGPDGKITTNNYVVPVIELPQITAQALGSGVAAAGEIGPAVERTMQTVDRETAEVTVVNGPPAFTDDDATLAPVERVRAFVLALSDETKRRYPKAKAADIDAVRSALVSYATRGRTSSSRAVLVTEWVDLQRAFADWRDGRIVDDVDGTAVVFVAAPGAPVAVA